MRRIPQQTVGKARMPAADPTVALDEIERRRGVAGAGAGGGGGASQIGLDPSGNAAATRAREAFLGAYNGVWLISCANAKYPTVCKHPNIRLLRYFDSAEECAAFVRDVTATGRVKEQLLTVPANTPFLIPYSEAARTRPDHVLPKVARIIARHTATTAYRTREMAKRLETKSAGATGTSTFARKKQYLATGAGDGVLPPRLPLPDLEEEAALQREVAAADAAAKQQAAAMPAAPPPAEGPPPEIVPQGAVGSWPAEFSSRAGRFAMFAYLDDDDTPGDSPEFPDAAGREPLCIAFGGAHKSVEDTNAVLTAQVLPWCKDLDINIVDTEEWLSPTEIDPDAVQSKYHSTNAAKTSEMQVIMDARLSELQNTRDAQEALGDRLPVVVVGEEGPAEPPCPVSISGVEERRREDLPTDGSRVMGIFTEDGTVVGAVNAPEGKK